MKDLSKYNPDDVVVLISGKDSYNPKDYTVLKGFTDEPYTSPQMWHKAEKLESGNWKISVTHLKEGYSRVMDIEISDEDYKKYGIADLKPSVVNPFSISYDDANLVPVNTPS